MVDQHAIILEALRAQDEDRLEKVIRTHVEGAKTDLLERMSGK
jgi:DNA-binding GntR family transcriptional regulator